MYLCVYIYIYISLLIWMLVHISLTHTLHRPYCPVLLAGILNCIRYLHRAFVGKLLLVNQHWHVHRRTSLMIPS